VCSITVRIHRLSYPQAKISCVRSIKHTMHLFAATTEDGWRPGIGDPTVMGWVTVAAYFIVAVLCFRAYTFARPPTIFDSRTITRIWLGLGLLFIALGINKQLDLQSLFTQIGRSIAKAEGWYGKRHEVQALFIAILSLGGLITIIWLFWLIRHATKTYGLALIGTIFTITFIIIRAASFHGVDQMLGWSLLGVEMNWLLELSGITCVGVAAVLEIRRSSADRQRRKSMNDAHQRWNQTLRTNGRALVTSQPRRVQAARRRNPN
jgi:hypothetical protein